MTFDGLNDVVTNEHQEIAAEICLRHGGTEMVNSIPTVFRAEPFGGVRTVLLGSEGELWLPVHGFFPLSRAVEAGATTERFFEENRELMEKHNIRPLTSLASREPSSSSSPVSTGTMNWVSSD